VKVQRTTGFNYGMAVNYDSYSYDMMGRLTQIQDSGRNFTATVTNDMNGNIIEVSESPGAVSTFTYDNENRLTEFTIGLTGFSAEHTYDGFNRLIKTDATVGLNTTNYEHTYAGKRHLGNIDVTNQQQPVNGKVWRWEGGAGTPSADPIEAPQRSSASGTQYYMLNDERTIEKRSYQVGSVVAGDTNDDSRYAEWQHVNGAVVPMRVQIGVPSELFSAYAITLDADRASSAATNHALQLGATDLEYEVTRVKSPVIGRDMNPMGRGDGTYYCNGGNTRGRKLMIEGAKPRFLGSITTGYGSSVNNCYGTGCGLGLGTGPGTGGTNGAGGGAGGNGDSGGARNGGTGGQDDGGPDSCHIVWNRMQTRCHRVEGCISEGCMWDHKRYVMSCFDHCTKEQCDELKDRIYELGELRPEPLFPWCQPGVPCSSINEPCYDLLVDAPCDPPAGNLSACLCSGLCLDECMILNGLGPLCVSECDEPIDSVPKLPVMGCDADEEGIIQKAFADICGMFRSCRYPGCMEDHESVAECIKQYCKGERPLPTVRCIKWPRDWLDYIVNCAGGRVGFTAKTSARIGLCPKYFNCVMHIAINCCAAQLFHELIHTCQPVWKRVLRIPAENEAWYLQEECYIGSKDGC